MNGILFKCLFGGAFAIAGGAALWLAVHLFYQNQTLRAHGAIAAGTVIEMRIEQTSDGTLYRPVIDYRIEGHRIHFASRSASNPPAYTVGQAVKVLYDPDRPYEAAIDSPGQLWVPVAFVTFLGVAMLGAAAGSFFLTWE